jgi:ABC-type multidrug transport system ATPase subunit
MKVETGCRLLFHNVSYTVPDRNNKKVDKTLLTRISGRVIPGELCALMGASGAGKSTLLDVLAGRKTTGVVVGDILFNGQERGVSRSSHCAYVLQDAVHVGSLTLYETLMYSAYLRLDSKSSKSDGLVGIN